MRYSFLFACFFNAQSLLHAEKSFKLVGTLEAGKETSRALLEITGEPVGIYCSAGQECRRDKCDCEIGGAVITRIGREHIWLKRGREHYRLDVGQASDSSTLVAKTEAAVPASPPPAPPPGHTQFWRTLHREIERNKLADSARTGELRNRNARKVADVLFESIGLRASDTIVKVQNVALKSSESWGNVYDLLKAQKEIFIETEREGKPMLFKIQVRE